MSLKTETPDASDFRGSEVEGAGVSDFRGIALHSGRVPLLLLGRSHLYRFIQIFLKFSKIYDQILKIFVQN